MTEKEDDDDIHDVVVESWMQRLKAGYNVCFETMYDDDVAARLTGEEDVPETQPQTPAAGAAASETPQSTQLTELVSIVTTMRASMEELIQRVEAKMSIFEAKMDSCEAKINSFEARMERLEKGKEKEAEAEEEDKEKEAEAEEEDKEKEERTGWKIYKRMRSKRQRAARQEEAGGSSKRVKTAISPMMTRQGRKKAKGKRKEV